mmetsp:Transcript_61278/g.162890  ORF Transcript_61278/g.162890 Transcript_61278/m.162890 type:complete len:215 (-) Transcript_61278:140-784(-)
MQTVPARCQQVSQRHNVPKFPGREHLGQLSRGEPSFHKMLALVTHTFQLKGCPPLFFEMLQRALSWSDFTFLEGHCLGDENEKLTLIQETAVVIVYFGDGGLQFLVRHDHLVLGEEGGELIVCDQAVRARPLTEELCEGCNLVGREVHPKIPSTASFGLVPAHELPDQGAEIGETQSVFIEIRSRFLELLRRETDACLLQGRLQLGTSHAASVL